MSQTTGPSAGPQPLSEVSATKDRSGQKVWQSTSTYPASRRSLEPRSAVRTASTQASRAGRFLPLVTLAPNRYPACGSRRATDRCFGHQSLTPTNRGVRGEVGRVTVSHLQIVPDRHRGEPVAQRAVRPPWSPVDPGGKRAADQAGRAAPNGGLGGAGRRHRRSSLVIGESPVPLTTEEHSCLVCGITLFPPDFAESDEDYYCPFCSTGQKPSRVHHRKAAK